MACSPSSGGRLHRSCRAELDWDISEDTSLAKWLGRHFLLSKLQRFQVERALYIEHSRVTYYGLLLA